MEIGAEASNGIDTRVALEHWSDACDTLRGYFNERLSVVQNSITSITDPLLLWQERTGERNGPDLIFGGPPCQAFSQAGKQKALDDSRGQLIYEYLRFIECLQPTYFVMENVPNLKGVNSGKLFRHIQECMIALDYEVNVGSLLAADYGVPQLRRRLFFIGVRKGLGKIEMPKPTHTGTADLFGARLYTTVGEAFHTLPRLK